MFFDLENVLGYKENNATRGIADYVNKRIRPAHKGGNENIVFKSQKLHDVEILADFHRYSKQKNINGQQFCFNREKGAEEKAQQNSDQNISAKGADKAVVDKKCNQHFKNKNSKK